jgi:signal transduction histidine kinase
MIRNILNYVQLDSGAAEFDKESFSLRAIVHGAFDAARKESGKGTIRLELAIADDVSDALYGPKSYVNKVFGILIENALKFSPAGAVRVEVREESLGRHCSWFHCSVSDQGIGIPVEFHEKIFEPFVQADSSRNRKFEGIGLGLAIARRMVERMGGTIHVQCDADRGSTFSFPFYCELQS